MEIIEEFKAHYSQLSDKRLIALISDAADLKPELIPVLHAELIKRNKTAEAEKLMENMKLGTPETDYKTYNTDEITNMINHRIESGESLESIKDDLKNNDIDIFRYINEDIKTKEDSLEYLTDLINEGVEDEEIKDKMAKQYAVDVKDLDKLKSDLRIKGNRNLGFGIILFLACLILLTSRFVPEFVYLMIAFALWCIYRGLRQLQK